MSIKSRLKDSLLYLNIGQNVFERKVGISNGYINNIKGSIGSGIITKISKVYPELDTNWLLIGKGEMLSSKEKKDNSKLIPFMQQQAMVTR